MTIYDTVECPGKVWVHVSRTSFSPAIFMGDSESATEQPFYLILFLFSEILAPYAYRISGWKDNRYRVYLYIYAR